MSPSAARQTLFVDAEAEALNAARPSANAEDFEVMTLTVRLVAGEEAAWRQFHDAYFDRLLRYLLVVCSGDEHVARESLQAALVKIARHVRRFDRAEAWWSWLTVVIRSCVIDGARRQSSYRALLERYASYFSIPAAPAGDELLSDLLEKSLKALPDDARALLTARYRDGRSNASLADESGCSEKAIESRLARLRQRVKAHILQRLRDEN